MRSVKTINYFWHLPNDMKFFKNTTWGMPVVMGRKTFEALAGNPLPGRFNFVISRKKDWDPHNDKVKVVSTLQAAIGGAKATDCREAFVIGGGEIYAVAMPVADRIYMTRVHAVLEGDTSLPGHRCGAVGDGLCISIFGPTKKRLRS